MRLFHIIRYILKRQGSEEMAILTIKDLDFSYHSPQGETKALTDINLTVNEGEFISIVGPSGCGKSTLLSIIAGLTPVTGGFLSITRQSDICCSVTISLSGGRYMTM